MARTNAPDGRHIPLVAGGLFMASQDGNNVNHVPKEGSQRVVAGGIAVPATIGQFGPIIGRWRLRLSLALRAA
jgi:hypothetical protein